MVITDDAANNQEASALRTVSIEYNRIQSMLHQYSQISTKWEANKIPRPKFVT
jgi:hypothetical protein